MKTALIHAHIYLHPDADALLIEDERIAAFGNTEDIAAQADEVIDVKETWIYPGLHDSHLHLAMTGQALACADLSKAESIADIQKLLKKEIQKGGTVHGMGWNQENLSEKRMPTRVDIDAVSSDIPIVIERSCTHILSANTAAMQQAGLWHEDGIFSEDDCLPFMPLLEANEEGEIEQAVEHCLDCGLSCVQIADLKSGNWRRRLPIYQRLSKKIRIHHQVNITDPDEMKEFLEAFEQYKTPTHTIGPFKGFADGALGGRTAWMQDDYADDPGNRGICTMEYEEMDRFVKTCQGLNRPVIFHAIGDAAIRQILDIFEKYQDDQNTGRWGILHVQITDEDLLARLGNQKILIYAQPVFWKADQNVVEARVGKKKAQSSYAFGTLYRKTHLSMGTDCPIEDCNPIENAKWARALPDALVPEEIIRAYTIESAYSAGMEQELGRIEPGYLADLTFFDQAWTTENSPQVMNVMVNGQLRYPFFEESKVKG